MSLDEKQMVENEIHTMIEISIDSNCSSYVICYHDSFDIPGSKVIVMEYIDSSELFNLITQGIKFTPY